MCIMPWNGSRWCSHWDVKERQMSSAVLQPLLSAAAGGLLANAKGCTDLIAEPDVEANKCCTYRRAVPRKP